MNQLISKRKKDKSIYTNYRINNSHHHTSVFIEKDKIIKLVLDHFGITMEKLASPCRRTELCRPRQILMFFLINYTNMSLKGIGEMFGKRDHTTVIHSRETIEDLMDSSDILFEEIKFLTEKLLGMHIKVDSDEKLVKVATEGIHILNNLLEANRLWDETPCHDTRQNKNRWEKMGQTYLAEISGEEIAYKSETVKIILTHESGISE